MYIYNAFLHILHSFIADLRRMSTICPQDQWQGKICHWGRRQRQ